VAGSAIVPEVEPVPLRDPTSSLIATYVPTAGNEPMAAPTDSLRRGGHRVVNPGESAIAQFRIKVS
jgi:hypothetical protein